MFVDKAMKMVLIMFMALTCCFQSIHSFAQESSSANSKDSNSSQQYNSVDLQMPQINISAPSLSTYTNKNKTDSGKPLSPEWYIDSDGNFVPDLIEIELGHDPGKDDCFAEECELELENFDSGSIGKQNTLIILDSSGSMAKKLTTRTRIESAKDVLLNYVKLIPSITELAFMVYGHQGDNAEAGKALVVRA